MRIIAPGAAPVSGAFETASYFFSANNSRVLDGIEEAVYRLVEEHF
jgi:hypothetical protein